MWQRTQNATGERTVNVREAEMDCPKCEKPMKWTQDTYEFARPRQRVYGTRPGYDDFGENGFRVIKYRCEICGYTDEEVEE